MKNKGQYQQDLLDIKNISNTIRKMNESVMFEDEYDDLTPEQEQEEDVPAEEPVEDMPEKPEQEEKEDGIEAQSDITNVDAEEEGMAELDKMGELDQIRRITLDGMRKLSDNPEHPQFQALLKIFQLCNKAVEPKQENQQGV